MTPLTVGAIREQIADLPDDAQVFVQVVGFDLPINGVIVSRQISWSYTDPDPTPDEFLVWGLEIWAGPEDDDDPDWIALVESKIRRHYEARP